MNDPKKTLAGSFFLFEPSRAFEFFFHERLCCSKRAAPRSILLVPHGGIGTVERSLAHVAIGKNIMRNNTLYCEYLYLPTISRVCPFFLYIRTPTSSISGGHVGNGRTRRPQ